MNGSQPRVRLRQAVLVADELEPVASALREAMGLGEPFRDPGVGLFGLRNVVFALGDCFIEIVSPTQPDTAAGRYLERHGGDGGYMVMFDLEDLAGARARAAEESVRVVWEIDLSDISGTHLHPADMRGAIVSIDGSVPYGSWRWGGPQWTERVGNGSPGRLAGVTLAVADPEAVATRWARVLGSDVELEPQPTITLEDAEIGFVKAPDQRDERLVEITVADVPPLVGSDPIELGGVRLRSLASA